MEAKAKTLPKGEANLQLALQLYYYALTEIHICMLRVQNSSFDKKAENDLALENAHKKFTKQAKYLAEVCADQFNNQFAQDYRIWSHDTIHRHDKIKDPISFENIKTLYKSL